MVFAANEQYVYCGILDTDIILNIFLLLLLWFNQIIAINQNY